MRRGERETEKEETREKTADWVAELDQWFSERKGARVDSIAENAKRVHRGRCQLTAF